MTTRQKLLSAVAIGCLAQSAPALGQVVQTTDAVLERDEIVVSARKREESIMNVPVVTTAIGHEELERFKVDDIRRVAEQVPGLIVGETSSAALGTQISLRGVGTSTLNGTIDQSISLNVDSQQFTHGLAFTAGMFDLGQITVLKGPQALFFGKGSPGGVIAIRSADPGPDFELIARAGYEFEARTKQADLIVSGPVTDTLGLRFAGRFNDSEGYFRNVAVPIPGTGALEPSKRRLPNFREWLFRGTAMWEPNDRLDARLKVTYSNRKTYFTGSQFTSCPDGTAGPIGIPFIGNDDCVLNRELALVDMDPAVFIGIPRGGRQFGDTEMIFASLELNYDITDAITFTSVTGFFDVNNIGQFNGNSSGGAGSTLQAYTKYNRRDISQEIRLTSDFAESPVNFTLGAFIEDIEQFKTGIALGNQAYGFLPANLSLGTHDNPWESQSIFGQLLWKISPQLELAGGARWTHEERRHEYFNLLLSQDSIALAVPKISSSKVSPEATLTFTPTNDLTLFAAYKKGYKSGAHNSSGSFRDGDDSSFNDETVEGGEIGVKARLFNRTLNFNVAAYYYDYGGLQVGANSQSDEGLIVTRTLNAASSEIYGLEMDLSYSPPGIEGLNVRAAANWNHGRYKTFNNAPCWGGQMVSEGCNLGFQASPAAEQTPPGPAGAVLVNGLYGFYTSQDLSGKELLRSPDFTATFGFDYEQPIGQNLRILFASSLQYSSKYYADILLREDQLQPSYAKISANITLYGPDDRWELSLIGNNLTDKLVRNRCSASNAANGAYLGGIVTGGTIRGLAGVDEILCGVDAGREIWVRAGIKF